MGYGGFLWALVGIGGFWWVLVGSGGFWCVLVLSGGFWCVLVGSGRRNLTLKKIGGRNGPSAMRDILSIRNLYGIYTEKFGLWSLECTNSDSSNIDP